MNIYAVVLTIPGEAGKEISNLRNKHGKYLSYTIEPHVTLKYPLVPKVDLNIVNEKLEAVARRTKPFTLVLNGIKYFEGVNNVAYIAIENKQPVIDLHIDVFHSIRGLVEGTSEIEYNLERFTPHVTISEHIPDEVFPSVKKQLSEYELRYEVRVVSLDLYSSDQKELHQIWKRVHVFELSRR